jgi:release factor glutamine methyltransferase
MLASVLHLDRLQLYLQFERPLEAEELAAFKQLLLRRAAREPLQYILGTVSFRGIELTVDRRALIPRPETEELVEQVLEWARVRSGLRSVGCGLTAADLGTGTGAIALALAVEGDFDRIVATDISEGALELAEANADRVLADRPSERGRVAFRRGDLFEGLAGERFHVIVTNPPYIEAGAKGSVQEEVEAWEPDSALFAGEDGLDIVRRILGSAADHLELGGLLAMEIGAGQGAAVRELPAPGLVNPRVARDLSGRDRFLLMEREDQ